MIENRQKEEVLKYYDLLNQKNTELRAITFDNGKSKVIDQKTVNSSKQFLKFCEQYDGKANIYAGIHERSLKGTKSADVIKVNLIALDIDSNHPKGEAANKEEMKICSEFTDKFVSEYSALYGKPTVIMTGNGYQVLWRIQPIKIDNSNRGKIERKIHNFIAEIMDRYNIGKGVTFDQIGDLARILKVPGTTSIKGNNTEDRPYRIAKIESYCIESSEKLRDAILMTETENKRIIEVQTKTVSGDIDKFDRLLKKDDKLNELYSGLITGYKSRSEAEMALVFKLVYYDFSDSEINMIMNNSGIGKWKEATTSYKKLTLDKAKSKVISYKEEEIKLIKSSRSIDDVHQIFKKWIHIEDLDRIDLMLAVALSSKAQGPPLWIIFVGPSGDAKTEVVKCLEGLSYTYKVLQLTENTLVSGMRESYMDLAPRLNKKIMLITDFASILSLKSEKQRELWAQLRNLYDGEAYKESGAGAIKHYDNLRVTMIACSTHAIDSRILVHQDLGTRELVYRTDLDPSEKIVKKAKRALMNEGKEEKMRKEIKEVVHTFLSKLEFKEITVSEDIEAWLIEKARWLSIMRSNVSCDSYTGEILGDVHPEIPTRLIKQLKRIYICLKNLDKNYSDDRAKRVIDKVVRSSAKMIRVKIFDYMKANTSSFDKISLSQVAETLKVGKKTVGIQLNILWNLGLIERETLRTEQYGKEMEISKWYYQQAKIKEESI